MFEWDDARYFLAVQRAGTLSAAARKLKVNQSTVGRRLSGLEDVLGVKLFQRSSDGFTLTLAGERFLPRAERIEAEIHETAIEISGQESKLTGTVRMTTPDAFGPRFIAPLLGEFHRRFPEIDLEMIADNRRLNLSRREADMAIRVGRPNEPSLLSRCLGRMGYAVYAAPAYVAERGRPKGFEFSAHDLVMLVDSVGSTVDGTFLARHAKRRRAVFKSNSSFALLGAVTAGLGIGVLPCYLVSGLDLVRLLPPERVVVKEIWLVLHKELQHAARIRAVVEFLVETLHDNAAVLAGSARALTSATAYSG
jgi:DNA-binding transcriptional LysR family regulator